MYWTCELGIVCTFERVVCNILWISDKFGRLWYINVVCDILLLICGLWYIYALLFTWKRKKKFRGGFPECLSRGTRQRGFFKKKQISLPSAWAAALGKDYLKKIQKSSPSVALGEEKKENGVGRWPTASNLSRVPARHSAKPSPSAWFSALEKDAFAGWGLAGGSSTLPRVLHSGKAFPSATGPSPSATGTRGSHWLL